MESTEGYSHSLTQALAFRTAFIKKDYQDELLKPPIEEASIEELMSQGHLDVSIQALEKLNHSFNHGQQSSENSEKLLLAPPESEIKEAE